MPASRDRVDFFHHRYKQERHDESHRDRRTNYRGGTVGAMSTAHADSDSYGFLNYLARHGEDVSTPEVRYATIDYGHSIWNLYRVSRSNDVVLETMSDGSQNVPVYTVGSVQHLFPEWKHLLP